MDPLNPDFKMPDLPDLGGWIRIVPAIYKFGSSETSQLMLTTIGGIVVVSYLLQIANWLLSVIQSPRLAIYRHAGNDSWALVTGANDGIGRAFSEELLKRGFNVLLHGRNPEKLERVKKELLEGWPKRQVDTVVADAAKYDNAYETVVKKAKSLPGKLTILVNNVGGQITLPRYLQLSEVKHEDIDTCMNVNARFPTHLSAATIPLLRENSPSLILNCGSMAGVLGSPYLTTYSATKAYIHNFSVSLKQEMIAEDTSDVDVMGFIIGNTETTGNPHDMPWFTLKARHCADSCLDRVGKGSDTVVYSHWRHRLSGMIATCMPKSVAEKEMIRQLKKRAEDERREMGSAKKDL